jgi:hypothetical protein
VALALTAPLWALLYAMLFRISQQQPMAILAAAPPTWTIVLESDLAQVVAPSKSLIPVVRLVPASAENPFDRVEIQTFDRPGDPVRGPATVSYEVQREDDGFTLVRVNRSWEQYASKKHILLEHVQDWQVSLLSDVPDATGDAELADNADATTVASAEPTQVARLLRVTLHTSAGTQECVFSVPRWLDIKVPASPTTGKENEARR